MSFAKNVQKYRNEKKLSEQEMASALSCSLEDLIKLENGEREPSIQELMDASKTLGVSTDVLLGQKEAKKEDKPFDPLSAIAGLGLPGGFSITPGDEGEEIDEELALELAAMVSAIDTRRTRIKGEQQ